MHIHLPDEESSLPRCLACGRVALTRYMSFGAEGEKHWCSKCEREGEERPAAPARSGWLCPRCGASHAPTTPTCLRCAPNHYPRQGPYTASNQPDWPNMSKVFGPIPSFGGAP